MECAEFNSPQVVKNPYCVKFVNEGIFSSLYLNEETLPRYPVKQLILVSTLPRTKGFASKAKADADDVIVDYCIWKDISKYTRKMKQMKKTQPTDFQEDLVKLEMLHQLHLVNV